MVYLAIPAIISAMAVLGPLIDATPLSARADTAPVPASLSVGITLKNGADIMSGRFRPSSAPADTRLAGLSIPLQADGSVKGDNLFEVFVKFEGKTELERIKCKLEGRLDDVKAKYEIELTDGKHYVHGCEMPNRGLTLTCGGTLGGTAPECAGRGGEKDPNAIPAEKHEPKVYFNFNFGDDTSHLRFKKQDDPNQVPGFFLALGTDGTVPTDQKFEVTIKIDGKDGVVKCQVEGKLVDGAKDAHFVFNDGKQYLPQCGVGKEGISVKCGGTLGGPSPDCTNA